MLAYNDKLYIIGGKQTNLCEIYNFNALKFEHMSPLIFEERQWPMLIVYNHFLYAFLGLASGGYMKSIERINIRNPKAKWELVPFKNDEELKVITERKDAIENHEKIYAKYYSKARKQREKVKLHSDEYRY